MKRATGHDDEENEPEQWRADVGGALIGDAIRDIRRLAKFVGG